MWVLTYNASLVYMDYSISIQSYSSDTETVIRNSDPNISKIFNSHYNHIISNNSIELSQTKTQSTYLVMLFIIMIKNLLEELLESI